MFNIYTYKKIKVVEIRLNILLGKQKKKIINKDIIILTWKQNLKAIFLM